MLLSIFRNQMQSVSLKGDGSIVLAVSLSICSEGSSPMLLSAPLLIQGACLWIMFCGIFGLPGYYQGLL